MKKVMAFVLSVLFFTGCSGTSDTQDKLLQMREQMSQQACGFSACVQADFGKSTYEFSLDCIFDTQGNMTFTVLQPETISGITGVVTATSANLTFDDTAVAFSPLADGELTPIIAPWLMMKGLRSGYLSAWQEQNQGILLTIDDTYDGSPIQFRISLSENLEPIYTEILKDGRCVLSVRVENFRYL